MDLDKLYQEAASHTHLAGLQAIYDAAKADVLAELDAVKAELAEAKAKLEVMVGLTPDVAPTAGDTASMETGPLETAVR